MSDTTVGKGYGYCAAILGAVMIMSGSVGFKFDYAGGKTIMHLERQDPNPGVMGVAIALISGGLGIRFTIPGLVGALLPSEPAVRQLGEILSQSKSDQQE